MYIEVVQGAIFMEQNMRFGLILGRLKVSKSRKKYGVLDATICFRDLLTFSNTEKKNGVADYEQLLRVGFSTFCGQKKKKILKTL